MQVAEQVLLTIVVIEEQLELELQQTAAHALVPQEAIVLMTDQLEEQTVQVLLKRLTVEQLGQQQEAREVQEVLQHQAEATDLITLVEAILPEVMLQVEVLPEVTPEVVQHQAEVLAEVVLRQAEVPTIEAVALAEVLPEETNKKFGFKLYLQNQFLSLTL